MRSLMTRAPVRSRAQMTNSVKMYFTPRPLSIINIALFRFNHSREAIIKVGSWKIDLRIEGSKNVRNALRASHKIRLDKRIVQLRARGTI